MLDSIKGLISFEINNNIEKGVQIFSSNLYDLEKIHIQSYCREMDEECFFFHRKFLGMNMNGVTKRQVHQKKQRIMLLRVVGEGVQALFQSLHSLSFK